MCLDDNQTIFFEYSIKCKEFIASHLASSEALETKLLVCCQNFQLNGGKYAVLVPIGVSVETTVERCICSKVSHVPKWFCLVYPSR